MGFMDLLRGNTDSIEVSDEIKRLPSDELVRIMKSNPYGWSIAKMAQVATEVKRRGLDTADY